MKKFLKNSEGNVFIVVAFAAFVIITLILGGVDVSKAGSIKSKFAQNVDKALLAAVSGTTGSDEEKTKLARQFFEANMPNGSGFELGDIKIASLGDGTFQASAAGKANSFMSSFIGDMNLSHSAKAKWDGSVASEIVLVANVSGTMCTTDVSVAGEELYKFAKVEKCSAVGTKSKFNAMKDGFKYMIDSAVGIAELQTAESSGNAQYLYKVGIVPFNHKVKMPNNSGLASVVQLPSARKPGFQPGVLLEEQYTPAQLTEANMFVDGWDALKTKTVTVKKVNKFSGGRGGGVQTVTETKTILNLPAGLSNLPGSIMVPPALAASEGGAAYYQNFNDAGPLPMVYPLINVTSQNDRNHLVGYIDSMYQDYQGDGWNRTNIGLLTAALMLDPAMHVTGKNYFGGAKPEEFGSKANEKIIVLMTDGANTGCCFASFPEETFEKQYLSEYVVDNAHMIGVQEWKDLGGEWKDEWTTKYNLPPKGICTMLKENGVKIYSIALGISDNNPTRGKSKEVLKECASGDEYFYDLQENNEEQLFEAYDRIASSLVKLKIIE